MFSGEVAFKLHDTYGFPIDLTQLMAEESGLTLDSSSFTELMEEQRERARLARTIEEVSNRMFEVSTQTTEFRGYESYEVDSQIVEVLQDQVVDYVVLEKTPFYAESGGQVGVGAAQDQMVRPHRRAERPGGFQQSLDLQV